MRKRNYNGIEIKPTKNLFMWIHSLVINIILLEIISLKMSRALAKIKKRVYMNAPLKKLTI